MWVRLKWLCALLARSDARETTPFGPESHAWTVVSGSKMSPVVIILAAISKLMVSLTNYLVGESKGAHVKMQKMMRITQSSQLWK
jgi:hypothetical protein